MSGGGGENADDVGARTPAPIEACATIDDSRVSNRTVHTQCSHTRRQQRLAGREVKNRSNP